MAALGAEPSGPPVGYVDLLAVSPEAQGRGGWAQVPGRSGAGGPGRRGRPRRALGERCPAMPGLAWTLEYSAANGLFESAGFRARGEAVNMIVRLSEAPLDTTADERRLRDAGISRTGIACAR